MKASTVSYIARLSTLIKARLIQQVTRQSSARLSGCKPDTADAFSIFVPAPSYMLHYLFILVFFAFSLGGCTIKIQQPTELTQISLPSKTKVIVTGNASYSGLRVTVDGTDYSNQMASAGSNRDEGELDIAEGAHTITANAAVYCWYCSGGTNQSTDTKSFKVLPHAYIDISAGDSHTCAVDKINRAYCWGDNTYGQLGTGSLPDLSCGLNPQVPARPCRPNPVALSGGQLFVTASAGDNHSCGLTTAGEVYCWGRNNRGQLGNGTTADSRSPVKVLYGRTFKAVSAGGSHSCAIDDQSWLFCWGDNSYGQLGAMGLAGCPAGTSTSCSTTPVRQGTGIPGGSFMFLEISAGKTHTCGGFGWIKCWGDNSSGQLGTGPSSGGANANISVSGQFVTHPSTTGSTLGPGLSAGAFHSCALRASGSGASCWGANNSGQLGGSWPQSTYSTPMQVAVPGGSGNLTRGISAGGLHSCALYQDSSSSNIVPVCAGYNAYGQLGNNSTTSSNTFTRVSLSNPNQDFFKVSAGGRHSCALNITGRLTDTAGGTDYFGSAYCWGDNSYGQVGQNYQPSWRTPRLIHQP